MLGKDLLIASNGRVIAAQRTCSLNMQQDTIEVCSPVSGPWREYIPSTLGWDVSCDGLIYAPEYADELMEVLTRRQKVRLSYYDPELRIVRSGYAIPTGLQQGASISDLANYSLTFQGSGELSRVKETPLSREYTWLLSTASLVGYDATHKFVEFDGDGLKVWKLDVNNLSRLRIEQTFSTNRPFYILCQLALKGSKTELVQVQEMIADARDNGMLRFYAQNELAHSHINDKTGGFPIEEMDELLNAGVYYVISTEYALPLMSLLSLPTE